jgi:DNA-binding MarR family transcriptional regulator
MKKETEQPAGAADEGVNGSAHINKGFVILPTQLLAEVATRKISTSAYALYAFLLFWQGTNSRLWYGVKAIARKTGLSQSKVKRLFTELIGAGHIRRTKTMSNSHTECLTRVDKSRKVFVCGEEVESRRVFICGDPVDVFLGRNAAKNGDPDSIQGQPAVTTTVEQEEAVPVLEDKGAGPSPTSDWNVQKSDESWKERLGWSESRELIYEWHLKRCGNREKAKRRYIEEIMWEGPEAMDFAQSEYPDLALRFPRKKREEGIAEPEPPNEEPNDEQSNDESENSEPLF